MPQLDSGGGGAGGGDDLGAPDELLAFQDEGEEQDDKSRDSAAGPERDLAELKSSLVNESEGAGGPGPGAGTRGEAEVGPEVSSGPRPVAPGVPPARPALTRPALPRSLSAAVPRVPSPTPSLPGAPHGPLWVSPQALGREHTSQRLFPDKLAEPLEDGEFPQGSPPPASPPWERGATEDRSGQRGCPPLAAARGGGKAGGGGGVGGGLPGRCRARVTSGALTFIGVNRPPPSPPPLLPR